VPPFLSPSANPSCPYANDVSVRIARGALSSYECTAKQQLALHTEELPTPKRRANNEGTLSYHKARKRWIYLLPPDETGKRQQISGKTQAEAIAKAEELKAKRAEGIDLDTKQPTIQQFSGSWLRDAVKRTRRPSTHASYAQLFRLFINPKLGKLRIDKLTAARVQGWVNMLVDGGQAAGTVRNAYLRLREMLDVAVRYRLISANPAKAIDLPPLTNDRTHVLSLNEARSLRQAADGKVDVRETYTTKDGRIKRMPKISARHTPIYHLLLGLGLRRGEVLGLGRTRLGGRDGPGASPGPADRRQGGGERVHQDRRRAAHPADSPCAPRAAARTLASRSA